MDFRLLGPLEVFDDQGPVAIGGGRRRSLLALLLLHRNEVVSAERLIDELWGEQPPATAAKGLQVHVSRLRKELHAPGAEHDVLETRSNGYLLRVGTVDLDVARFERGLSDGERAFAAGDPRRAAQKLGDALALWRGPPLVDFTYEAFAQQEIARLSELRLVALEGHVDAQLALGRHPALVGELESLVLEHPLRERLRAQLMLALYRCGRQAEALDVYRDARRRMIGELGLEPSPALRELEGRVLDQSPELDLPAAAPARRGDEGGEPATPSRENGLPEPAPAGRPPLPAGAPAPAGAAPPTRRPAGARALRALRLRPALLVVAGLLLGGAAVAALVRSLQRGSPPPSPALDLAANSVAALGPSRGPTFALPLPGRPTGIAAARGTAFVATVDSSALTVVDAASRSIVRTIPLAMSPAAVAVGGGGVWVADARRGLVVRIAPGYERPTARIVYRRPGPVRPDSTAVATGPGSVWLTDGSTRLRRVDPRTRRVTAISVRRPLDGVAVGAGAVWAFSGRTATVVRVDPRRGAVTDAVRIVTRPGAEAPFPIAIAATADAVWVLNGNTATVTRIDPEQRGVTATIPIGVDRAPRGISAAGRTVWIANFDGTLSRIRAASAMPSSRWVGESLDGVAADGARLWVTTSALDRQLPGGAG